MTRAVPAAPPNKAARINATRHPVGRDTAKGAATGALFLALQGRIALLDYVPAVVAGGVGILSSSMRPCMEAILGPIMPFLHLDLRPGYAAGAVALDQR